MLSAAIVLLSLAPAPSASTQAAGPLEGRRVCVLDLNRLGDDPGLEWLGRGLADMLIVTLAARTELDVLEREHLRAVLQEHELALCGIADAETELRQARILRADLLLAGSYALLDGRLLVQARLIRVADQELVAEAGWEGPPEDVLLAPRWLCDELSSGLGAPRASRMADLAERIPRSVDVAAAYYRGIGAFEEGDYPGALAFQLEASSPGSGFLPAQRAVIRTYYLLDEGAHAVLFAAALGQRLAAEGRLCDALELTYAAAELAALARREPPAAIPFLEQLVALAEGHERESGELERTMAELTRAFSAAARPEERKRGAELRYRLASSLEQEGWWQQTPADSRGGEEAGIVRVAEEPTAFVWRTRALRDLARAYAWSGRLWDSLASYRELLALCAPLHRLAPDGLGSDDALRTEAHFMWLRDYARTGRLLREHALRDLNPLTVVEPGRAFERDFADPRADPRARTASRHEHHGHEFFDFASPEGFQIDSVALVFELEGLAECSLYVPEIEGWPPRYSFSRRIARLAFTRPGTRRETIALPAGTELVSLSTSWGSDPFGPLGRLRGRDPALPAHQDIRRWRAEFELSRKRAGPAGAGLAAADSREADRRLIEHHAARGGWRLGAVLRPWASPAVAGSMELHPDEWMVAALDGDLVVHHRDRSLRGELPIAINTPQREFAPCLVRTHGGSWGLLWARGSDERSAQRFVAHTRDLVRWETPRRMRFEPAERAGLAPGDVEGSRNVCRTSSGYLMLVERGLVRRSEDLWSWGAPSPIFEREARRSSLARTEDGSAWAACVLDSDALEPYTPADWLSGYFVIDGRRYRHVCELRVAASRDGRAWEERGRITLPGQASGLWAFPIGEHAIGIAVQFNGRFLRWFAASDAGGLRPVPSELELQTDTSDVDFFVRDGRVLSLRQVFDHFTEQRSVLLGAGSRELFEDLVP